MLVQLTAEHSLVYLLCFDSQVCWTCILCTSTKQGVVQRQLWFRLGDSSDLDRPILIQHTRRLRVTCTLVLCAGFLNPTGPVKSPPSGSGLPDRFDRQPVETGRIQIQIQNRMCNRFRPIYRPVWLVYRPGWPVYRPVWPVWGFFIFLNSNLNFELGPVDRFDRFTGRFDRFTGRFDW